jgi:hypothetical protein
MNTNIVALNRAILLTAILNDPDDLPPIVVNDHIPHSLHFPTDSSFEPCR